MSSIPIVGLTTYHRNENGQFVVPDQYVDAIRRAGATVVLLPPGDANWRRLSETLDGLVLSGGGDIDPKYYKSKGHEFIYNVSNERDDSELSLAEYALENQLPTLAICRGMQIINVLMGGTLHEHVPDVYGEEVAHRIPPRDPTPHSVAVEGNTELLNVLGEAEFSCQSWHHQSVNQLASNFTAIATAPDGCIEAMESTDHSNLLAVQWHPELTAAQDPIQQNLFDSLVRKSS